MPYIGNTIRAADDYRLIDDISSSFNGSTTSFALQVAGSAPVPFPKSPQQVLISVNGVIQEPDPTGASGFNLVGTNIVFSSAPTNGHAFFGIIYATADYLNAGGNFPAGALGSPSITFIGDENTGLYRKGSGSVGFVSDATEIANFDSNGITISSGNFILGDSSGANDDRIKLGASGDLEIFHNGSHSFITDSGTGDLKLRGSEAIKLEDSSSGKPMITCTKNFGTEIYHQMGSAVATAEKKFETTTTGVAITGKATFPDGNTNGIVIGDGSDLKIFHNGSHTYVENVTGNLNLTSSGAVVLKTNNNEDSIVCNANGSTDLYHDNSIKLATKSNGIDVTGDVDATGHIEVISDSKKFMAGASNDARMYHDGTDSYFDSVTGNLYFYNHASSKSIIFGTEGANRWKIMDSGHYIPNADSTFDIGTNTVRVRNGYFDTLYGDGSNLTGISSVGGSTGVDFNDNVAVRFGTGNDATVKHDGYSSIQIAFSDASTSVSAQVPAGVRILNNSNTNNGLTGLYFASAGGQANVGIFAKQKDNATASTGEGCDMWFYTKRNGQSIMGERARFTNYGHFIPAANSTYDLGDSSYRWRNIYTADLKLSNEGSQNSVDSTWGDYTIQEGYEDLFLINNRTGKKFKFNLTEVG